MSRRITVGEIAETADVGPSAVSNWRSRHSDFPLPVEETSTGDLFDMEEVVAWLKSHGKKVTLPERPWVHTLWSGLDALRENLRPEDSVLLFLQTMLIRQAADQQTGTEGCWRELVSVQRPEMIDVWRRCATELAHDDDALQHVFRLPPDVNGRDVAQALETVQQLAEAGADWGSLSTELLRRLHDVLGARGGAATPDSVAQLQIELLRPLTGTVYDPACGTAMALARAWDQKTDRDVAVVGQEVNAQSWRLGYLHLALHGANFDLRTGDTLRDDQFRDLSAARVIADPPFGMKSPSSELAGDSRWRYGVPRKSADWLWAQVVLDHMAANGRACMTIPPGALFRSGQESQVRAAMLDTGRLDAVIELPPGLWWGTKIPAALLFFSGDRSNREDYVLFVDGRQLGEPRRGKPHELGEEDIRRITDTVQQWRSGDFEPEPRFSASVHVDYVLDRDADLSPKRYVQYSTRLTEIETEPIDVRLRRLKDDTTERAGAVTPRIDDVLSVLGQLYPPETSPYELVRLETLLQAPPKTGRRQKTEGAGHELPYVDTGTVSGGARLLSDLPNEFTIRSKDTRLVRPGDVLLVSRGIDEESPVGCAVVDFDEEAAYSGSLLRLRPDPRKVDPVYLMLFMTSRQGRMSLAAATTGSVIANLKADAVKQVEIPLPSLSAQRAIAEAARTIMSGVSAMQALQQSVQQTFDTFREGAVSGIFVPEDGEERS